MLSQKTFILLLRARGGRFGGLSLGGLDGGVDGGLGIDGVEGSVDGALVLEELRLDHGVVDDLRALVLGKHAPHQEGHLDRIVEGDPVQNVVREVLHHTEECEDHPVGQPLSVVVLAGRFDGSDTTVRRIHKSNEICDVTGPETTEDAESENSQESDDEILNVYFCLLFDQFGILLESSYFENLGTNGIKVSRYSRHVYTGR